MNTRPNLSDLATRLGIHKSTVSRALKNDPKISQETIKKVHALAKKMNYQRDPALAALSEIRWRKSKDRALMNWAFLITRQAAQFKVNQLFKEHIFLFAKKAGYTVTEIVLQPETTTQELCRIFKARSIRGLIIKQIYRKDAVPLLDFEAIQASVQSTVYCGNFFFNPKAHRVVENIFAATITTLSKVREKGFKNIALLYSTDFKTSPEIIRQRAAAHIFSADHPDLRISLLEIPPNHSWTGPRDVEVLVASQGVKIDHLPSPFCNLPFAVLRVSPDVKKFSGIIMPYKEMALTSVELLDFHLKKQFLDTEYHPHTMLIESEWQDGSSLDF